MWLCHHIHFVHHLIGVLFLQDLLFPCQVSYDFSHQNVENLSHMHVFRIQPWTHHCSGPRACMRWMAQSFRSRMEGRVWGIAIGGRETSWLDSQWRKKKSEKHANLWKSGCATSAFSQQVLSLKHSYHAFAISELDSLREESGSVSLAKISWRIWSCQKSSENGLYHLLQCYNTWVSAT